MEGDLVVQKQDRTKDLARKCGGLVQSDIGEEDILRSYHPAKASRDQGEKKNEAKENNSYTNYIPVLIDSFLCLHLMI